MPRVADHSEGEESLKGNEAALAEENGAESDGEGAGEEYEIEEVLDAKRGVFPDGRMGYHVKWRGYGPQENSWVDELDAGNAKELVEEFWRKNPQKKRPVDRKSLDKKSPDKGRKSVTTEHDEDGERKPKKRGRKSAAQAVGEDDMEIDQQPRPKKARKNQPTQSLRTETPEEQKKIVGDMSRFLHLQDWEGLVSSVDTVEHGTDDDLMIYFTLNTGETVVEKSGVCNKRFPQTMLKFYENNLRWRTLEEEK